MARHDTTRHDKAHVIYRALIKSMCVQTSFYKSVQSSVYYVVV